MNTPQSPAMVEVAQIERALALGPTPGKWSVAVEVFDNEGMPETAIQALDGAATVAVSLEFGDNNPGMRYANACLIAACNPENIRALLAKLAAERAEVVRLREALEEIALAGMSPSPEMSQDGVEAWHARRAWEFIRIAARAISPAALATPTQGAQG